MYRDGVGMPRNPAEAARLYRLAAERGDANAQASLASLDAAEIGLPRDHGAALRLNRLAAARHDGMAMAGLGIAYVLGNGVARDPVEACRWWSLAGRFAPTAELRTSFGQSGTAIGSTLPPAQRARATQLIEAVIAQPPRSDSARNKLGNQLGAAVDAVDDLDRGLTAAGRGDPATAIVLFQRAADAGHAIAQLNLGLLQATGQVTPRDMPEAWYWLSLTERDHPDPGQRDWAKVARMRAANSRSLAQLDRLRERVGTVGVASAN